MMLKAFIAGVALLFLSACSTMQTSVDYNPEYDFGKIHTFAVVHKLKEGENSLTAQRIEEAITKVLQSKGFQKGEAKRADILFLFHVNVTSKTQIYTDYQMVGYGYYGAAVISVPKTYEYEEGKLIIDAYDAKMGKIVFRVVLKDELKNLKTPQEREAYIQKVVTKALENFPPKKGEE